jgi:hypothetical protein
MRLNICFSTIFGLANASALIARQSPSASTKSASSWRPKTQSPEFFSLKVDEKCDAGEAESKCPFAGYAIRLEDGIVIATPYNKWWDPKLPIFFVDDDTQCYTVGFPVSLEQQLWSESIADRSFYRSARSLCSFTSTLLPALCDTLPRAGYPKTRSLSASIRPVTTRLAWSTRAPPTSRGPRLKVVLLPSLLALGGFAL